MARKKFQVFFLHLQGMPHNRAVAVDGFWIGNQILGLFSIKLVITHRVVSTPTCSLPLFGSGLEASNGSRIRYFGFSNYLHTSATAAATATLLYTPL
jgi:hypothetical protein